MSAMINKMPSIHQILVLLNIPDTIKDSVQNTPLRNKPIPSGTIAKPTNNVNMLFPVKISTVNGKSA